MNGNNSLMLGLCRKVTTGFARGHGSVLNDRDHKLLFS